MSRTAKPGMDDFTFGGQAAKVVVMSSASKDLVILRQPNSTQALAVAWDVDPSGYGCWRIQQIGVEKGKLVTKMLKKGEDGAAFYGEVSVVGAGNNDLYTSDGFEDADIVDGEGNVVNKVREVKIFPRRTT